MTTFSDNNPSYRVYQADAGTYQILNYDQYRINVTHANLDTQNPPDWFAAYNFLEEYNLPSVDPSVLVTWAETMQGNLTECATYIRNKYTNPTNNPVNSVSHDRCMDETCEIMYPMRDEQLDCSDSRKGAFLWIIELVSGPWLYLDYS